MGGFGSLGSVEDFEVLLETDDFIAVSKPRQNSLNDETSDLGRQYE